MVGALLGTAAIACSGANDSQQTPDTPRDSIPAPAVQIDYESRIGVARAVEAGVICVAMPGALARGAALTLVSVPVAPSQGDSAPGTYSHVVRATITGRDPVECSSDRIGHGLRLPGDSLYAATVVRDSLQSPVYFAVDLPFDSFFRVGEIAGARLSEGGAALNFRMCASAEGLHLTAWEGRPLTGKRVWRRYYYVGRDMQPTCVDADHLE
jgi:hypothetical protein